MSRLLDRLDQGKLYHSISEVCHMTGLEPHVLRYWETEFAQMRPKKNRAGNRVYRSKEIQYVHYIRYLLHEEKYTIQGAKKKLSEVTPDEVAGQLSMLRPYMLGQGSPAKPDPKAGQTPAASDESAAPKTETPDRWRGELEKIRGELRELQSWLAEIGSPRG